MRKWSERLYAHRIAVGWVILLLTAFFAWQIPHLVVATYFRDLYPKRHPHSKLFEKYPQFGSPLSVFLVVQVKNGTIYNPQTLAKIQQATRQIDLIPGVDHNQVLSIASPRIKHLEATVGGIQASSFLVGPVPHDVHDLEKLRIKIRSAPEVMNVLVSRQEDAALIQATFIERLADYTVIFRGVNDIIERLDDDNHAIYAAGQPLLSGWVYFYQRETLLIFAATLAAMILLLAVHVGNLCGIATPIIVSATAAVWGLGIAALLKVSLDPLIMVLPVLLIARSFSHAIQACGRYFEIYADTKDQKKACIGSVVSIFPPGVLSILTDAAGLFLIGMAPIPLMEKAAIVSGFWALSLIPANVVFTPIVLSLLPPPRHAAAIVGRATSKNNAPWLSWIVARFHLMLKRVLNAVASLSQGKYAGATALTLLIVIVWSGFTAKQLAVGDEHPGVSLLWPDSAYNSAVGKINERFPGFDLLQIVLESGDPHASVLSPDGLDLMQRVQRYMAIDPEVGGTFSFADLVTSTHRLLHGGLPKWGVVPENERDAAMISQLALSGAGPGDADRFFTGNLEAANINIWYKDHRSTTIERALSRARAFQKSEEASHGHTFSLRLASGTIGLLAAIHETVARAQLEILLSVLAVIFVMCSITYRSVAAALLLLIPVSVSNLVAAALMVCLDIGLDVNTLPVLAVGTGVGIDYGIYLVSRIREEFPYRRHYAPTLFHAITTTGQAILFTASALALGVAPWYFLSSLRFQANMGLLIAVLMIINMIAALVIIPLLISALKPRFISRA